MMSLLTAELVIFDKANGELVYEQWSGRQNNVKEWVIGVKENAHVFDYLEDLGEL